MTPQDFQLAVISAGVLINLPILSFVALTLWRLDVRLARLETRLDHVDERTDELIDINRKQKRV